MTLFVLILVVFAGLILIVTPVLSIASGMGRTNPIYDKLYVAAMATVFAGFVYGVFAVLINIVMLFVGTP